MGDPSQLTYYFAQSNFRVGDIKRNTEIILETIKQGEESDADLVIFPELALSGYPPRDFLHYSSFHNEIERALDKIIEIISSCCIILGVPLFDSKNKLRNAALVINETGIVYSYYKTLLPDYDVFDESRYFYPNIDPGIVKIKGVKVGLQICEDAWDHLWMHPIEVTKEQKKLGAELIINISASPFTKNKAKNRLQLVNNHVEDIGIPFIYANLVGCQDDLVFDGRSFVVNAKGELCFSTPAFETGNYLFDGQLLNGSKVVDMALQYFPEQLETDIELAIIHNLRDYLEKSHLSKKLLVSLSGGIDSALTLTLASKAVDPENIIAVYMPTKFSAKQSYADSKQLCENLGVELKTIEIEDLRLLFHDKLHSLSEIDDVWKIADENIQSRIRSNIMMYLSNSLGSILISTGNKSEIATGYCTLYGDTAGGKNLIGDLYKTEVYELARFINSENEIIPNTIIERPPTAELKEDQKDEDSLPPYDILDGILDLFVDNYRSENEIIQAGFNQKTVSYVIRLVLQNEFKRDQLVQSVKVSEKAFGSGRRFPIAANFFP